MTRPRLRSARWPDEGNGQRGAAGVEHAALVLLVALIAFVLVATFSIGNDEDASLASAIAFKQRCAVRHPDPCWRDPLTEAYGRDLGGAMRALAPARRRPWTDWSASTTAAAGR